ncbi:MAG: hypothetical protein OQK12_19140 [Motiliproteus sp.]|nr:hypothetical protein [Motiliproteus sp.]MCW9050884.1 hypothetical protein [Motiliproteus sp.]
MSLKPFNGPASQQGMGLVAAIFVITVMALVSVGISNLVLTGQQSYGHEILSTRAFLAAESGAQLAVHEVLPPSGSGSCSNNTPALPAAGLSGCQVSTSCTQIGPIDGINYYNIESTGQCGADADLAVRKLTLRIRDGSP